MKRAIAVLGVFFILGLLSCENADDLIKKGDALSESGNNDQAILSFTKAIKIKPSAQAYTKRGVVYYNQKKYNAAVDDYTSAIGLDKDFYDAYLMRGISYYYLLDYDKLIPDLNLYTKFNTTNDDAYVFLAAGLYANKQYQASLDAANTAIKLNPQRIDGYNVRGAIYLLNKNFPEARDDYNTVLKLDPDNSSAKESLAQLEKLQAEADRDYLRSLFGQTTGDPYTDLYNFGYNLGMSGLLGN